MIKVKNTSACHMNYEGAQLLKQEVFEIQSLSKSNNNKKTDLVTLR